MGATACSSESGCRRPSGTARPNIEPAFRTPCRHAASSVISLSSFSLAALAQPCHFGIAVVLRSTTFNLSDQALAELMDGTMNIWMDISTESTVLKVALKSSTLTVNYNAKTEGN